MSGSALDFAGGCACGGVRFTVRGPLRHVIACHCRTCRRLSGHFVAASAAPRAAVRVTVDETLRWWESSPGVMRAFCGRCGAPLFWDDPSKPTLSIFAGALDDAAGLAIVEHIHGDERGAYYEIDGAPPGAQGATPQDRG